MQTRLLAIIGRCDHIAAAFEGKANLLLKVALWKKLSKDILRHGSPFKQGMCQSSTALWGLWMEVL